MDPILYDTSPEALAAANEANLVAFFRQLGRWSQAELYEDAGLMWIYTGLPFPMFNSIACTRLAEDDADARIDTALARLCMDGMPLMWWIGPGTRPADLGRRLEARGLSFGHDSPGMAADLLKPRDLPAVPGLTIEIVHDRAGIEQWRKPFEIGFEFPDFVNQAIVDFTAEIGFAGDTPFHHYVGQLDGETIACASLFFGGGAAGIYNVATIAPARRKGIGTALTQAAMRDARDRGYRIAILQASEMGESLYRRLGFEEYCKIGYYVWMGNAWMGDDAQTASSSGH